MKYTLFISLLLVASCGQKPADVNKNSFAADAERHLPVVVDVLYPHAPNSNPEISEQNTLYSDDSLHIASFVMKYQNPLGISVRDTFQYIFGRYKDASYYYLLSPKTCHYDNLMGLYKETLSQPRYQNTDSKQQSFMLHGMASFYCKANNGGKLKE